MSARRWTALRDALAVLTATIALLAAGETLARLAGGQAPPLAPPQQESMRGVYSEIDRRVAGIPTRPKEPGTLRVAVLGESTPGLAGFQEALRERIQRQHAGMRIELIDAAVGGIDSAMFGRLGTAIWRANPDLVFVYFGHNYRFRHPSGEGPATRLLRLADRSLLARLAAKAAAPYRGLPPSPLARLEQASRFVDRARGAGVPVVMCVPAGNLDYPPARDPGLDDPELGRGLGAAAGLLEARRFRQAAAELERLTLSRPGSALAWFQLGSAYAGLGRAADACAARIRARDQDPRAGRATTELESWVRDFSRRKGLLVADAAARFEAAAARGVPGFSLFFDNCHPWPSAYSLVLEPVADALSHPSRSDPRRAAAPEGRAAPVDKARVLVEAAIGEIHRYGTGYEEQAPAFLTEAARIEGSRLEGRIASLSDADLARAAARPADAAQRPIDVRRLRSLLRLYAAVALRRSRCAAAARRQLGAAGASDLETGALVCAQRRLQARLDGRDAGPACVWPASLPGHPWRHLEESLPP